MNLSIDELLRGKGTIIKNKEYFPTKVYVEPFLDKMSSFTNNFVCKAQLASQLTNEENNEIYNRVWVQAILPEEYAYENHKQSVNLLYALDKQKPIVKLFKNTVNMACLNMCVFSPEYLQVSELEPGSRINFAFIKNVMEMTDNTQALLKTLSNTIIKREDIFNELGHWIDRCIEIPFKSSYGTVKIARSLPTDVYESLSKKKDSPYYSEDDYNGFDIYNAFTDIICNDKDKDILNKYEKVYLVSKILNIVK